MFPSASVAVPSQAVSAPVFIWQRALLRGVVTLFVLYLLWRLRPLLSTLLIAVALAAAADALVHPLCQKRVAFLTPRTQRLLATAFVFLVLAGSLVGAGALLVSPFAAQWRELVHHWGTYQATLEAQIGRARDWYAALPPDVRNLLQKQVSAGHEAGGTSFSPASFLLGALGTTVSWVSHITELILIPVLAFYFTLDAKALRKEIFRFFTPRRYLRAALAITDEGGAILRDYLIAQFWLAVIAGVTVGTGLSLLGMDYALILGIVAGVTRAIPVIGPLVGGVPITLLSFVYGVQQHRPLLWVWVLLFFTLLHLVESKFVMPKFLGHRLHLHAAFILIALLIGGEFFGLLGMFLAVPVAALARVLAVQLLVLPRRRALGIIAPTRRRSSAHPPTDPLLDPATAPRPLPLGDTRNGRLERALRPTRP